MSFASPSRDRMPPAIPLASMIDILFLMLTFFLTASAFRDESSRIDVSLPEARANRADAAAQTHVTVTIKPDGSLFINNKPTTLPELQRDLQTLATQFPDETLYIRGDRDSRLGLTIKIMDAAYAVGLKNVFLETTKPSSEVMP